MTVEGVPTAKVAVEYARRCGLELPIFRAVASILSGELALEVLQLLLLVKLILKSGISSILQDAHVHLMGRPLKLEF